MIRDRSSVGIQRKTIAKAFSLMTQTLSSTSETLDLAAIATCYSVAMPCPETHLFEVTLTIDRWTTDVLDLKFPVWTPGSYLVREYVRHLQGFSATDATGHPLDWTKISKNHWQVQTPDRASLTICYRIFANELTVRTNHLDITHGYFNPAAMFFRVLGREHSAIALTITPPHPTWKISTPLKAVSEHPNIFIAHTFDELVDSPFEIGTHTLYNFEVLGKPHQFAIWGQGNLNVERVLTDTQKIIEVEAKLFGGLPYDSYLFLLHLTANAYGGLEHKAACSLIYSRFSLRNEEGYAKFMSLVAHEFFHLWNVKRIRPKGLEVFNYDRENYTESLWFCEGTTSFYDLVIPLRAGLYDAQCYLKKVSEAITQLQTTPGRTVQPLSESSFDAWIKLYRPDANSKNAQVSYYLKGELVSFLLDLLIRNQSHNARSMDDVMHQMWQQFGQPEIGFTREQLKSVFESVAGIDLTAFWTHYIDGTAELPFSEILAPFGLELKVETPNPIPYLGLIVKAEHGSAIIKFVEAGSPAEQVGLEPGDELLAIDGFRVTVDQLSDRLQSYEPENVIEITVFHQDVLHQRSATLGVPMPSQFNICPVTQPTPQQQTLLQGWLGTDL
jgi:predicted metalloprotease with PDZ domain